MRRIGDCIKVSIWRDPWLLDDMSYIQSETDTSSQLTNVSDLLTEGRWNTNLIRANFNARDVDCILQIPLSRTTRRDE